MDRFSVVVTREYVVSALTAEKAAEEAAKRLDADLRAITPLKDKYGFPYGIFNLDISKVPKEIEWLKGPLDPLHIAP